jgi:DNA polymerase-1
MEIKYKDDIWVLTTDGKQVLAAYRDYVAWLEGLFEGKVLSIFSDSHSFRKDVYPAYKSNRKGTRKPMGFKAIKDTIMGEGGITLPSCEADDTIGIYATGKYKGQCIIVSHDKDFLQIQGKLFNPSQYEGESVDVPITTVDEKAARLQFYKQAVCGDAVDGYSGCPGVGEITFVKEINKHSSKKGDLTEKDLWDITLNFYSKKGLDEDHALSQARCAKILTHELYDFKRKQPILWTPPR